MATMPTIGIDWSPTTAPFDTPSWESLTSRCRSFSIHRGRNTELDQYEAGTVSGLFDNRDRALDPYYSAGGWYGNILPERYMRYQATYGATTYDLIYAYTDSYPLSYPASGFDSVVQLNATDGMKVLSVDTVDQYELQLRADTPTHLWRFDESDQTSITAVDSGYGTARNGTLALSAKWANQPVRLGSTGALECRSQVGTKYAHVVVPVAARPSSTTLWSIEGWFQLFDPADSSSGPCLFQIGTETSGGTESAETVSLRLTYGTSLEARMWHSGSQVGSATKSAAFQDATVHHFVVTYSGTNTRFRLYVDGALAATDSTGIPATYTCDSTAFTIGCSYGGGTYNIRRCEGSLSDFAVYDGVELTSTQVLAHYNAGANGFSGEGTGTRAGRVLDQIGWPAGRRTIATGDVNVGVVSTDGNGLDILQTLARTEGGTSSLSEFYIERDGNVMWRDRSALVDDTRSNTSQATFGDAAGELAYTDIVIDGGSEITIRNDVTVTRNGGTPQHVSDATSITAYTKHTYSESGSYDETDATALTKATAILARFKDPKLRITEITIMPGGDPDNLYPQVLGRKIGDRITVKRRPQGLGTDVISQDCWIDGIQHDVTPELWVTKFQLVACS